MGGGAGGTRSREQNEMAREGQFSVDCNLGARRQVSQIQREGPRGQEQSGKASWRWNLS